MGFPFIGLVCLGAGNTGKQIIGKTDGCTDFFLKRGLKKHVLVRMTDVHVLLRFPSRFLIIYGYYLLAPIHCPRVIVSIVVDQWPPGV